MTSLALSLAFISLAILIPIFLVKTYSVIIGTLEFIIGYWITRKSTFRFLIFFPLVFLLAVYESFAQSDGIIN